MVLQPLPASTEGEGWVVERGGAEEGEERDEGKEEEGVGRGEKRGKEITMLSDGMIWKGGEDGKEGGGEGGGE